MIVDVPRIIEEARQAAREGAASAGLAHMGPLIESALEASLPAAEASIAAVAESIARESLKDVPARERVEVEVSGRQIEIPVKRQGRVIGKANATLDLGRTLPSVLSLAPRDQGEIPFAIDQRGALYTVDVSHRETLQSLEIEATARSAADGDARRVEDWIVVARRDASGMLFGIARPIGESLREIRRLSWRNCRSASPSSPSPASESSPSLTG